MKALMILVLFIATSCATILDKKPTETNNDRCKTTDEILKARCRG